MGGGYFRFPWLLWLLFSSLRWIVTSHRGCRYIFSVGNPWMVHFFQQLVGWPRKMTLAVCIYFPSNLFYVSWCWVQMHVRYWKCSNVRQRFDYLWFTQSISGNWYHWRCRTNTGSLVSHHYGFPTLGGHWVIFWGEWKAVNSQKTTWWTKTHWENRLSVFFQRLKRKQRAGDGGRKIDDGFWLYIYIQTYNANMNLYVIAYLCILYMYFSIYLYVQYTVHIYHDVEFRGLHKKHTTKRLCFRWRW